MSDAEKEAAIEDALHAAGYVLCGECARSKYIGRDLWCTAPLASSGLVQVCDDDFCSYGFREDEDE